MSTRKPLPNLRYSEKFRHYQHEAIREVRKYRADFSKAAEKNPAYGAFLVCHPTATGKTAVIAGLAQACPEIGNVLILTTREAVRDQLVRELSGNIFIESEKFALGPNIRLSKNTYVVDESRRLDGQTSDLYRATLKLLNTEDLRAFYEKQFERIITAPDDDFLSELAENRSIVVMTVQMLIGLDSSGPVYAALRDHIELVLFDEGHYEPAAKYSAGVRGLRKPVVLLSATPFRNDLKPFQIDASNIHIYRFAEAVEEKFIRSVDVVQRQPAPDAETFCADIIDFANTEFGSDRSRWPRIIIHCEDPGSITRLGERFITSGFKDQVVAIHDRFVPIGAGQLAWQHRSVPPPRQTDAQIWIHQYKLIEGIDDHRFRILAFFDPLRNVRSVVQQIGRVIRLTPGELPKPAFVLDHFKGRIQRSWDLFLSYDKAISVEYLTKTMSRYYLDKFTQAQLPIDYIQKKFRRPLDLKNVRAPDDEILFDRRVTLKQLTRNDNLASLSEELEEALTIEDCEFERYPFGGDAALYVYAKVASPEFLNNLFFAEVRHGARLLLLLPKHGILAIASTGSSTSTDGFGHLESIGPAKLERLLMPGSIGRVSSVSSQNTNLGNRVVRSRTISAPSILDVPPILDEHGHIVSTVSGYNGTVPRIVDDFDYQETFDDEMNIVGTAPISTASAAPGSPSLIRRYIGMANGRVSEQGSPLRLNKFREWVESLADQTSSRSRNDEVYKRYAVASSSVVQEGAAKNLLLDIFDLANQYKHEVTKEPLRSDDLCVDRDSKSVGKDGNPTSFFTVKFNDVAYPVEVTFNRSSQRYKLESLSLDAAFVSSGAKKRPLCRALNDAQSFSIIPDDTRVIYVHGRFYAPGLKYGKRFSQEGFFVGHCLYPADTCMKIESEKGASVSTDGEDYDTASLFSLIDSWKNGFDTKKLNLSSAWVNLFNPEQVKFDPDLLVCDDMDKETADFILADRSNRRVVLVHAKASKTFRKYSASAVQEVCAQAQKNMALFSTYSLRKPENFKRWGDAHKFKGDGNVSLTVRRRIRKPIAGDPSDIWDTLSALLQNPLTTREVWLVLGNMLSAETFYKGLRSEDPESETLQLNHLLQTTIAAGGSVGAKTRIFCAP